MAKVDLTDPAFTEADTDRPDTERVPADAMLTIRELMDASFRIAHEHGWDDPPPSFAEAVALLHSECSEALEDFRDNHPTNEIRYREVDGKPEGIPIEFADIAIRLAHYAVIFGVDLEHALRVKTEWNKTRPHRHGGKAL
jgi:hypothetical protein